jgi:DNA-binding NarL/FixJ family response regulator
LGNNWIGAQLLADKVLIVEDEPDFLSRFADAVRAEPTLALAGAVSTVAAALQVIDAARPDVVLTDLGLPDGHGVDVIRHACATVPGCDVLVVTMFGDDGNIIDSIAAGATGYLLKDAMPAHIVTAIRQIRAGESPISPGIARRVLQRFRLAPTAQSQPTATQAIAPAAPPSPLSARETEILRLVAKGLSFKDVGLILAISPNTVVTHVKSVYQKLAVHSRGEAVYEANQLGLL